MDATDAEQSSRDVNHDHAFRYQYLANERPEVQRHLPRDFRRLLDVGCAFGDFGAAAKRQQPDAEVWGIDSASAVAEAATS